MSDNLMSDNLLPDNRKTKKGHLSRQPIPNKLTQKNYLNYFLDCQIIRTQIFSSSYLCLISDNLISDNLLSYLNV